MGKKRSKEKRAKALKVSIIQREHAGRKNALYEILDEVAAHFSELNDCKIVLAYGEGWKADADGVMTTTRLKKADEINRTLAKYDFVLLINRAYFDTLASRPNLIEAEFYNQLCRVMVTRDSSGELREDELGRSCYRVRKFPIQVMPEAVKRYGIWQEDLRAAFADLREPLFAAEHESAVKTRPMQAAARKIKNPDSATAAKGEAQADPKQVAELQDDLDKKRANGRPRDEAESVGKGKNRVAGKLPI